MLKLGLCQPDAEFEWLRGSGTKKNQAVLLAIGIQVQGLILGSLKLTPNFWLKCQKIGADLCRYLQYPLIVL